MINTTQYYVETPDGLLLARCWQPEKAEPAGSTIVLFHDSLGSIELWRDFPKQLSTRTGKPVVAYDRLGFGKSDPHPGQLQSGFIRDEADTGLSYVREALGIGRMILFGHSVGGAMAVACGAAFTHQADAVVTLSAQAFVEERTRAGIRQAMTTFAGEGQIERLARYHGDKAQWVLDAWSGTWLASEFATWTLDDALRRLSCPLLALHGDRDEYGSQAHPRRISRLAGGRSRFVISKDCGHLPIREKPETVLQLTDTFIRAL